MSIEPSCVAIVSAQASVAGGKGVDGRCETAFEQDLAVIRSVAERNGGEVLAVAGMQVQLAFAGAHHAVGSVLDMQGLFSGSRWHGAAKLRYRFGAHLGPVVVLPEGPKGEAVEIATGIQRIARTGGFWVSRAMVEAVKGRVAVIALPRGNRRLRELDRTVEVFELIQGLGPIADAAKRWRLSKAAPAWAGSLAAERGRLSPL